MHCYNHTIHAALEIHPSTELIETGEKNEETAAKQVNSIMHTHVDQSRSI